MREIPLSQGLVAIVDAADYDYLAQWKWSASRASRGDTFYAVRNRRKAEGPRGTVFMHTAIMGVIGVDHIDRNGLNNRRSNLRLATATQNNGNTAPYGESSAFKGVSWTASKRRWRAQISCEGVRVQLGYFRSEVEAARAYDAAARERFGEFAYLNFGAVDA